MIAGKILNLRYFAPFAWKIGASTIPETEAQKTIFVAVTLVEQSLMYSPKAIKMGASAAANNPESKATLSRLESDTFRAFGTCSIEE